MNPLQACTPAGCKLFVLYIFPSPLSSVVPQGMSLSSVVPQEVPDFVLFRFVQSSCALMLFGIYLYGYGSFLRDLPAPDKSGVDDDHQGDGDRESGVEAMGSKWF